MAETFKSIPVSRMLALASKADHHNNLPTSVTNESLKPQQKDCLLFGLAICEALGRVGGDIDRIMVEEIVDTAKRFANFQEYDMFAEPSGVIDNVRLVACQQQQLFFGRFAVLIAAELNDQEAEVPAPIFAV